MGNSNFGTMIGLYGESPLYVEYKCLPTFIGLCQRKRIFECEVTNFYWIICYHNIDNHAAYLFA